MFNTIVGAGAIRAGAVGAGGGATMRCGSGQKMRILAAPAPDPQHW
jgi:hypothetical protein